MNPNTTPPEERPGRESQGTGQGRVSVSLGANVQIDRETIVGYRYNEDAGPTTIGDDVIVRAGTVVYGDVELETACATGHGALIREQTQVGDAALIGSKTVLDGHLRVGADSHIQTGVYVPPGSELGDRVFLGPRAVLTNDPYPLRVTSELVGPTIASDATVGANATVLPEVTIGEGAFVAAGAVVTDDVPPWTLAVGVPATHEPLPDHLQRQNRPR